MSEENFKIKRGEELVIKIKKDKSSLVKARKAAPAPDGKKPNSLLLSRPMPDYLPRRKKPEGLINFYDLGQILVDEEYVDIDFAFYRELTPEGDIIYQSNFDIEQWERLKDLIFTVPRPEWKQKYKKLEYEEAERYGLDIRKIDGGTEIPYPIARNDSRLSAVGEIVSDTKWTEKGWQLIEDLGVFDFFSFGVFCSFGNDGARFKVTELPSPLAPAVSFTLNKKADVFLLPMIVTHDAVSGNNDEEIERIFGRVAPLRRAFWLDKNYQSGYPALSYPYDEIFSSIDIEEIIPEALNDDAFAYIWNEITSEYEAGAVEDFPLYSSGFLNFSPEYGAFGARYHEGAFVGAILQAGSFYYFWATDYFPSSGINFGKAVLLP